MESPVLIEHSLEPNADDETAAAESDRDEAGQDEMEGINPGVYMARVRSQADEVLRETEEMVKDLIQTARKEAEKIIGSANEEAARIVAEGQDKAKQIEDEARQQGWQDGYERGVHNAETEYTAKLQEANDIVRQAHIDRQEIIAGAEDEIVQLAMAVARKVISNELTVNPDSIIEIVKRAIQKVTDREEVTVRVNPENLDTAIGARDEIAGSVQGIRKFKVLADNGVAPGGCVIETPNGNVDARIDSQLGEIEQAIMDVGPNA